MTVSLRDARLPRLRGWFELAYRDWLAEVGARTEDVESASTHAGALLHTGEVIVLVIERNGDPAGFVVVREELATSGSGVTLRRVDEFYVAPSLRRLGVGAAAARLMFDRFGGEWEIVSLQHDPVSAVFWRNVLRRYAGGSVAEQRTVGEIRHRFSSRGAR